MSKEDKGIETYGVVESFVDYDDATHYFEMVLVEQAAQGWDVVQGSGVIYVNHQWRVGMQFEREKSDS